MLESSEKGREGGREGDGPNKLTRTEDFGT